MAPEADVPSPTCPMAASPFPCAHIQAGTWDLTGLLHLPVPRCIPGFNRAVPCSTCQSHAVSWDLTGLFHSPVPLCCLATTAVPFNWRGWQWLIEHWCELSSDTWLQILILSQGCTPRQLQQIREAWVSLSWYGALKAAHMPMHAEGQGVVLWGKE